MFVIPAIFYLFIGLAGCSVNLGISRGAYKLARTPELYIYKKLIDSLSKEIRFKTWRICFLLGHKE
jgi:hypothetical protein